MDILLVILAITAAVGLVVGVVWVARRALAAGLIMAARAKASGNPLPVRILGFLAFSLLLAAYFIFMLPFVIIWGWLKEEPKTTVEDDDSWEMYGHLPEHEWWARGGGIGYPMDS